MGASPERSGVLSRVEASGSLNLMGPPEDCTRHWRHSKRTRARTRRRRRPRMRRCLLRGCERRFRPRQARQRYCSPECRQAARKWSRWKAQQRYRATAAGKAKRNGQSRRLRERVRQRREPAAARVITPDFFRSVLRSPRLLTGLHRTAALPCPAILFTGLPARHRTSLDAIRG
jgi:hypothetical protein